jgi:hypothetical protein
MWKRKKKWRPKTVTSSSAHRIRSGSTAHRAVLYLQCFLIAFLFSTFSRRALPLSQAASSHKLRPSDPYALIFGTIWGPGDQPVFGIRVKIRRATDKKPYWEAVSDHAGEFAQRVPAGEAEYIIYADLKGVKTTDGLRVHLVQPVTVHVEYDERVDMSLHLTQ